MAFSLLPGSVLNTSSPRRRLDMELEVTSFAAGFGLIIMAFAMSWVFGLVAKMLNVAADDGH
jgi:hypothetical protein